MLRGWLHKARLFFLKDKDTYALLYRLLGFCPRDVGLYRQAFTHRSAASGKDTGSAANNERLELLGDAVIELVVSDYLFHRFADRDEGYLTLVRSQLVGRAHLSYLAVQIGIERHVVADLHNQPSKNILGNALEALIGAIYIDQGYHVAHKVFLHRILIPHTDIDKLARLEFGYKGKLLELVQKQGLHAYFDTFERTVKATSQGQAKGALFYCFLRINGQAYGSGIGSSKKMAEEQAAQEAFGKLKP